jgi:hypothetical protein
MVWVMAHRPRRLRLASELLATAPHEETQSLDPDWLAEIERRTRDLDVTGSTARRSRNPARSR